MSDVLHHFIAELRSIEHGQLIDRSRVIDHLLDLRQLVAADGANDAMVAVIDGFLTGAPGRTTVESSWWRSTLEELAALTDVAALPAI